MNAKLELYWIPLGAGEAFGARVVRTSGRVYEQLTALLQRRSPQPLFHAALVAEQPSGRSIVEMTPIPRTGDPAGRGVVVSGPVGSSLLGRSRIFRYEVRCWADGVIPDICFAVDSPVVVSTNPVEVTRVLDVVTAVPANVWGRDEARAGDMWNSNSVVAWTLQCSGLADRAGRPPRQGRAPGWDAGLAVARRDVSARSPTHP